MQSQKIIALSISVVLVTGTLGFDWTESLFPPAEAHGVQAQLQSRFIRVEGEIFSIPHLQTGETLTINGQLYSLVERDLRGQISIIYESTTADAWDIIARDPPGNVFDIKGNTNIPYSISAKALKPGVYHIHTYLDIASAGPSFGPGQTIVVEGDPIVKPISYTDIVYQSIMLGILHIAFVTVPWQIIGLVPELL